MAHIKLRDDDDSAEEYNLSDSEEDYDENEKSLLKKVRQSGRKQYSDDEDAIFNVGSESDDGSNKSDIAISDVEGQDDDELPDVRAWGKEKRNFYSTDYVDPDYGGYQGKDAALAEIEEEEARNLQMQLTQQLDDDDFSLELFDIKRTEKVVPKLQEEIIKTDITQLSNRQKIQLLQKESPEFFGLVEDFKVKMGIVKEFLKPVLILCKNGKVAECEALNFVRTYHQLILNYCTNIYMYLLLKCSKINVQNHPIIKRLYQYRQLLEKMTTIYEDVIKAQIGILLSENKNDEPTGDVKEPRNKRALKFLKKLSINLDKNQNKTDTGTIKTSKKNEKTAVQTTKKVTFGANVMTDESSSSSDEDEIAEMQVEEPEIVNGDEDTDGKRAITYQIAKNKGLMPHRKKEQRNPRVKHRNMYRKAKIRRKGAVRQVRTELKRYGGEISGIKAAVTKSIKIKT